MQRNKVLLISFTLMLLILSSIPAFAQQQGKIGPVLECVFAKTDGTYEARFGYNNTTGSVLEIPVGIDNGLLPLELNGIQPTLFETGRKVNVFQVIFSADPGIVLWKLGNSVSTAAASGGPRCRPETPTLSAELNGNTQVDLTWNAVSDVTGYKVMVTDASGVETEFKNITATQWSHTDLTCGSTYTYQIKANGVEHDSKPSNAVTVSTPACPPPAPAAPTFSAALVNVTDALLQWTAVEHAASYRVEQEQNGAWVTLATVTDTSYPVTGLACGTSANYRVVSVNVSGEGTSAPAAVTTAVCPPLAPTFSAALVNVTDALLQWTAVEHAASYRVEQEQNGAWVTLATVTDTSYSVTGLACSTSANYRVVSVNVSGEGASAPAAVTTAACPPPAPAAPTFSAALVNATDALLQWAAVEHAASYRVEQEQNGVWMTLATVTDTSYPVTGLACGTSANYRVVSVNVSGEGASAPAAVTTAACVINPVQLLTNPSFEQRLSGWKLSKPSQDGVRCPAKPVASDGQCFYFVRGSAGEKSVLNQVIDVTGMGIDNSTPLTFKMDLQSIGARKGLNLIINAVYEDGTWQQKRYWLPLNTKNYRTITRKFVPAKPVVRLNVVIRYTNANAAGVARFDNLSLSYMPTSAVMPVTQGVSLDGGLLPMPSAPQQ